MKKIKKILLLTDPYPNLGYEFSCYLKTVLGLILIILGIFLLLSPLLKRGLIAFGFQVILSPLSESIIMLEDRFFGRNLDFLSLLAGTLSIVFGLWVFWQIKLIRKIFKTLSN